MNEENQSRTGKDDLEQRLQRQPLKTIPADWRNEILAAAHASISSPRPQLSGHVAPKRSAGGWLRELFWPCPQAWAGLAAAWVVVFAVSFALRDSEPTLAARRETRPSPQALQMLRQQEQLLAELVDLTEKPEADRPKRIAPQPRSQRRDEFLNA